MSGSIAAWASRGLILFILAVLLSACADDAQGNKPAPTPTPKLSLNQLNITARDFSFEMPDTVPPGLVDVKLYNNGAVPHQALLARLKDGVTYDQLLVAFKKGVVAGLPLVEPEGGPNTVIARQGQEVIVNLPQGRYIVLGLETGQQGIPNLQRGMFKIFTVKGPASVDQPGSIQVNSQAVLKEFSFTLPQRLPAGEQMIKVTNEGKQVHELALLKLLPGKTTRDVEDYQRVPSGEPPFEQIGGTAALAPGLTNWMKLDLEAGDYLAVCMLPDAQSGKSHLSLGMYAPFVVE